MLTARLGTVRDDVFVRKQSDVQITGWVCMAEGWENNLLTRIQSKFGMAFTE